MSDITFEVPHPLEALFASGGFKPSEIVKTLSYPKQNAREPDVRECAEWYWVVVRDLRAGLSDQLRIEKCQPYRWTGDVGEGPMTCYGWTDSGGNLTSNAVAGVHVLDDCHVILAKAVE